MANSDRLFQELTDCGWTTGKSRFDSQHSQALIKYIQEAQSSKAKRPGREADHSPPSSNPGKECVELYLHRHMSLWRYSQAKCHSLKPEVRRNNEQNLPPTSQRTQSASITKGNRFVSFGDKIAVNWVSCGTHRYRCGHSVGFWKVRAGGTYSYRCALNIRSPSSYFRLTSLEICGNKMPTRYSRSFYCRSYCLLNRVMYPVCRMLPHPANRTHNPQLHTRPAT